jgi:hypothetical protein
VVLATSTCPDEVTKAREQINAIREVVRVWNAEWVQKAANQMVSDKIKDQGPGEIIRSFLENFVPVHLAPPYP